MGERESFGCPGTECSGPSEGRGSAPRAGGARDAATSPGARAHTESQVAPKSVPFAVAASPRRSPAPSSSACFSGTSMPPWPGPRGAAGGAFGTSSMRSSSAPAASTSSRLCGPSSRTWRLKNSKRPPHTTAARTETGREASTSPMSTPSCSSSSSSFTRSGRSTGGGLRAASSSARQARRMATAHSQSMTSAGSSQLRTGATPSSGGGRGLGAGLTGSGCQCRWATVMTSGEWRRKRYNSPHTSRKRAAKVAGRLRRASALLKAQGQERSASFSRAFRTASLLP
jgi:hypothetical protein